MTRPAELTPEQADTLIAALWNAFDAAGETPRNPLRIAARVIHACRAKTPDDEDGA
jgi:hypothetical protein